MPIAQIQGQNPGPTQQGGGYPTLASQRWGQAPRPPKGRRGPRTTHPEMGVRLQSILVESAISEQNGPSWWWARSLHWQASSRAGSQALLVRSRVSAPPGQSLYLGPSSCGTVAMPAN